MSALNPTAYTVLGLLSIHADLSGYDMRKGIQNSTGYFWAESYGQLYPALKLLAREGLIAPSSFRSEGRKRRTYVITEPGRTALRQWLALPFHNEPPRNEFLLKLFFGREAAPGVAAAHVRDLNDRNRRGLAILDQIEASMPSAQLAHPHMRYWMLTLSWGKAITSAALEWGEQALAALEGDALPTTKKTAGAHPQPPVTRTRSDSARAGRTSVTSLKHVRARRGSTRSERKVSS